MRNAEVQLIESTSHDASTFYLRWNITRLCNYHCDFCIQGSREQHARDARVESRQKREDVCATIVAFIESTLGKRYREVDLSLIGGEVTILPEFPHMLEELVFASFPGTITFRLTTNFSPELAFWETIAHIFNKAQRQGLDRRLRLVASFYPHYTTADEFIEKLAAFTTLRGPLPRHPRQALRTMAKHVLGRPVTAPWLVVSINTLISSDRDYRDYLVLSEKAAAHHIPVVNSPMRDYPVDLSEDVRRLVVNNKRMSTTIRVTDRAGATHGYPTIRELGTDLEDAEHFNPQGYYCNAGIDMVTIDNTGRVCRCPVVGDMPHHGIIEGGVLPLLQEPTICSATHCSCSAFRTISRKPFVHASHAHPSDAEGLS